TSKEVFISFSQLILPITKSFSPTPSKRLSLSYTQRKSSCPVEASRGDSLQHLQRDLHQLWSTHSSDYKTILSPTPSKRLSLSYTQTKSSCPVEASRGGLFKNIVQLWSYL